MRFAEHPRQSWEQKYRKKSCCQTASDRNRRCAALFFTQRQRKRQDKTRRNAEQSSRNIHPDTDGHTKCQRHKQPVAPKLPCPIEERRNSYAHHSCQQVRVANRPEICPTVGCSSVGITQSIRIQTKRVSTCQLPERQQTAQAHCRSKNVKQPFFWTCKPSKQQEDYTIQRKRQKSLSSEKAEPCVFAPW